MRSFAHLALAAGSLSVLALAATSADAQRRNRDREQQAEQPATPPVSRAFATAYQPLQAQLSASAWAAADPLLAPVQAIAVSPYEKYLAARADYLIATGLNNTSRRAAAATAMIDSNGITPTEQRTIYAVAAQLAYGQDQYGVAATRAKRALELGSTDDNIKIIAVDALVRSGQLDAAVADARAMIAAAQATNGRVPELIFTQLAAGFQEAGRDAEVLEWLTLRYQAYPTAANLRNNALIYLNNLPANIEEDVQRGISIDTLRLMALAGAMNERRFYVEYVSSLAQEALPNEALAAIEAGRSANLISAAPAGAATDATLCGNDRNFCEIEQNARDNIGEDRTSLGTSEARARTNPGSRLASRVAHSYYTYGNFAKAEELLTVALTKPDADADLLNLRLGQARLRQDNVAGALEALAQVQGIRAPLAKLWAAYIQAQSPAPAAAAPAAAPAPTAS